MTIVEVQCTQGSPEWLAARAGHVTGSRAADVLATLKTGKPAASREDYKAQLVCERLTGKPQDSGYTNAAMERGKELEPHARAAYEAHTGYLVMESGFLRMTDPQWVGCSLDGFISGLSKIVEIKCPGAKNHLKWIQSGRVPSEYLPQIRHNLWVTKAESCDFVSYHSDFPQHLQLHIVTVMPSLLDIDGYAQEVTMFLAEVEAEVERMQTWRT